MSEFNIIQEYFNRPERRYAVPAVLGIGDDCALLDVPAGQQLAVTNDTLVEAVHFLPGSEPEALGYKCLAVNLSDLAAMGARPLWFGLSLTLPACDSDWLASFSRGLFQLADQYDVQLIGGDTTRGPLSIGITAMGLLPQGQGIQRKGAAVGDSIYVSGHLGSAGLGLKMASGEWNKVDSSAALTRFLRPEPRVDLGLALLPFASACIDLSDGLSSDLNHILTASVVGATIHAAEIPMIPDLQSMPQDVAERFALSAGDDYELCFTVPLDRESDCLAVLTELACPVKRIGQIESEPGLRLQRADGSVGGISPSGFDHFGETYHGA